MTPAPASPTLPDTTPAVRALVLRLAAVMAPPVVMTTTEWARTYRYLNKKSTAKPGKYNPDLTPWVKGMHQALDDPSVRKVVCRKSAQVAWTDGVVLNYIGKRIHLDPCAMVVMFATDKGAKRFNREKLVPAIEVTPVLAERIPVHKSRDPDNGWDYKGFPGGFMNLVGSNSPDNVKSTPAPVVIVEEPDDSNTNVKDQGDTITLLEERLKSFTRSKIVFGGTPTVEGFSKVDAAYRASDQREFWVACPDCAELQVLDWDHVRWQQDPTRSHEVFGHAVLESARYCCAHCGSLWTDAQKNRAVREAEQRGGGWRAAARFEGTAGFAINELYSPFPGSKFSQLVMKFLTAQHALAQGDDTKARSFRNNTEGRAYAFKSSVPSADVLRERAEDYPELTVPWGGVVLTAGVDVQHDRLAVIIRAWGRGEESWLVWWGELFGRTLVLQWDEDGSINREASGAWWDLDQLLQGAFPHAGGAPLRVRAASIDSGDGQTSETVYSYVRRRLANGYMATKGDSHNIARDLFTPPKLSVDTSNRHKPHPSGVRPFIVGTQVGKDLVLGADEQAGRIKLQGKGPGRMHWYRGVRPDYWDQVTAEVKVPHKTVRNRLVWQCKAGRRNEATDCEVLSLHAARSLKVHLWREERWQAEEGALQQSGLFADNTAAPVRLPPAAVQAPALAVEGQPAAASPAVAAVPVSAPAPTPTPTTKAQAPLAAPRRKGFSAKRW